ncbi:MAG TPA: class I SAM-dependent methyltransferase [Gemmatimonadales bacterium]|nr:class I SAM-dependent methyltransferase [Gemmatimonadales bacterium]
MTAPEGRSGFRDHFSEVAAEYAAHRPSYPSALVDHLAGLAPARRLAWDSGCGSGQLSVLLAGQFERVWATDASGEQIARATAHPGVSYSCAPAQSSGLADRVVDLATAAQAAHWFDLPSYYGEVRRVARPGGIVALISYGVMTVDPGVDAIIRPFYHDVLGAHWPPERRQVDEGYRSLYFPFEELPPPPAPNLEIRLDWRFADVIGYVGTWSAVWALQQAAGKGPVETFRRALAHAWGPAERVRTVRWPLALRVGRV